MSAARPRILVAEARGFSPAAAELLRQVGEVELADLDRAALLAALPDAEVLWVRLRHRLDEEALARAPRLRLIATPTTGLNHIDLETAERRGVEVLSLRGETEFLRDVRATAELTLALMLALLRRLPPALAHARDGGWDRDRFQGGELHGRTVGLVGYGRIGRLVAPLLLAFGARVLATDPKVAPAEAEPGVELVPLARLLAEAEIVSLHVAASAETAGFFGAAAFAAMRDGALFVNTARGELVDEAALLSALESGRLAGAALDVLTGERSTGMGEHPLVAAARQRENLLVTPHLGGCTAESMAKTELFLARRLAKRLAAAAERGDR